MPHDPARVAETRAWLAKAGQDLQVAEHELSVNPPFVEDVLFHCQQAAEKALKAFLVWHDRPLRKTHDLVELGRSCAEIDADLEPVLHRAAPLTEYAWRFRYPGPEGQPSVDEAGDALEVAREVHRSILDRLPEEVTRDLSRSG